MLLATMATGIAQNTTNTTNTTNTVQLHAPCDTTAVIGLSSALGVLLAGITTATICQFKDHLCCTPGDRRRVYDTPCPYCQKKQPRDCMREHLTDCEEHRKYWTPRLRSGASFKYTRPSRLSIPIVVPPKPASATPPPTLPSV